MPSDEALKASHEWFAETRKVAERSGIIGAITAVEHAERHLAEIIDRHMRPIITFVPKCDHALAALLVEAAESLAYWDQERDLVARLRKAAEEMK